MFTPLSKGSERRQNREWEDRLESPTSTIAPGRIGWAGVAAMAAGKEGGAAAKGKGRASMGVSSREGPALDGDDVPRASGAGGGKRGAIPNSFVPRARHGLAGPSSEGPSGIARADDDAHDPVRHLAVGDDPFVDPTHSRFGYGATFTAPGRGKGKGKAPARLLAPDERGGHHARPREPEVDDDAWSPRRVGRSPSSTIRPEREAKDLLLRWAVTEPPHALPPDPPRAPARRPRPSYLRRQRTGAARRHGASKTHASSSQSSDDDDTGEQGDTARRGRRSWWHVLLRPRRRTVNYWLDSWWRRQTLFILAPCLFTWLWAAIPFPPADGGPIRDLSTARGSQVPFLLSKSLLAAHEPPPPLALALNASWPIAWSPAGNWTHPNWTHPNWTLPEWVPSVPKWDGEIHLENGFLFFLFWYYGVYLAVALMFITKLFDLYRLNWWPSRLGGIASYTFFWMSSLVFGLVSHAFDIFGLVSRKRRRDEQGRDDADWERKTFWIILTFTTMLMPALVCFSKLKREKRHMYRRSLTDMQKAFFEGGLFTSRIPSSWLRFLWFMTVLGIASFSLIAGQAFASLYLQTLPHTSLDAAAWVYTWVGTVTLLNQLSVWIISSKIRSRALLFLYKYFFQVVLFTFYRNLFARLRSPQQFAVVQLLSSVAVILLFPLQITRLWHRMLEIFFGYNKTYEEYLHAQSTTFYARGLAQNVTALSFLGWLCILHFGPNSQRYPFFRFSYAGDPYTFQLTFLATLAIWTSETISSYIARRLMHKITGFDAVEIGIDEIRQYPELSVSCGWASVHILSNILLFLINLDFE